MKGNETSLPNMITNFVNEPMERENILLSVYAIDCTVTLHEVEIAICTQNSTNNIGDKIYDIAASLLKR